MMSNSRPQKLTILFLIAGLTIVSSWLISCGGKIGNSVSIGGGGSTTTGTITTSLSDPPTCSAAFDHIWVTITKLQANTSSTAAATDSSWVTLVDFTTNPRQVDLLSLSSASCTLNQLGPGTTLPVGNYQQFRLYLLDNASTTLPSPNHCGPQGGFNCVAPHSAPVTQLQIGTASTTGIAILPRQISGGSINLTAALVADINLTFNSCASLIPTGAGQFRLDAIVQLGEVATTNNSISGKVVDSSSNSIAGAIVLLEQPDSAGIDRVMVAGITASDGTFIFCPLASGNYDVVADAATAGPNSTTTVYGSTVAFKVPAGTALGNVPLISEGTALVPPWGTLAGQVTSANAGVATVADVTFSALQQAVPAGSAAVLVTVPTFSITAEPTTITTLPTPLSGPSCASGTDCINYFLVVPSGGPQVGTFSMGSITYAPPGSGAGTYSVSAVSEDCTASVPATGIVGPVTVSPGNITQINAPVVFSGCTAPI